MKTKHLLLGGLFLIAAWLALFGDKTPTSTIAAPMPGKEPKTVANQVGNKSSTASLTNETHERNMSAGLASMNKAQPVIASLINRAALLGEYDHSEKQANSFFNSQTWTTPAAPVKMAPQIPQTPVAPPIPYSVLGKKWEDGIWEVFLSRNEQTYVVREKTILDDLYRIESIQPPTMTLTYLPLNQIQVLTIGSSD
ncbi:hypothetical protein [Undibacterium flavidum]|uniref:Secretion system X translation initiation factor n=1 Tax=Undibacterium flavidum TaxID=2762297 RepID=A0ABR6YBX6_9BURK|nr:hypothetical protein [Undibacterium flavidum]MBC3873729.1 hypothetical protein [Undibacterium flavidum]